MIKNLMFRVFSFTMLFSTLLFSHPHTFIDVYPSIEVKGEKITQIHFEWKLDEMTSSMLIMEFDQNGNGEIDTKENYYVYKNYFLSLEDTGFYTEIKLKDKTQANIQAKNFKVNIEKNRIIYAFDIEANYDIKEFSVEFGDKDFFVAMVLKPEFLKLSGAKAKMSEIDKDFYFVHRLELEKEE